MMAATLSPGVYRRATAPPPRASLATGVPGFVGFGDAGAAGWARVTSLAEFAAKVTPAGDSYLSQAVRGYFENGGDRCYVAGAASGDGADGLVAALESLAVVPEIDLVAAPDAALGDTDATLRVQRALLDHARRHRRFALLDAVRGASAATVTAQRAAIVLGGTEPVNGALYYPWLKDDDGRATPPSGHVAGIVARTDAAFGVARAPAGSAIAGVLDAEVAIDAAAHAALNAAGINCLRAFPGRGVRVSGARTLSADPDWAFVNVRRLFLTLARWIGANLGWAVFEPNGPSTWARIERLLTTYLAELWRGNALAGGKPEEAFFVRCDAVTNPPAGRDTGGMIVELGLAPATPAEFITVRLDLRALAA